MEIGMKYSIVIVTYNRCELLKEAIECAMGQIIKPKHVIVINNASDDGTSEYLEKLQKDYQENNNKEYTKIIVKNLKNNTGGAGGVYYGLKLAHKLGDDWHVLIDDDAMLGPGFMYKISMAMKKYKDCLCFAGEVVTDGNIITDHRQNMIYPGFRFKRIPQEAYSKKVFDCDTASFCGIVVNDELVEHIGYPEKKYFIWYDDTEYCVRIRKHSRILVVTEAVINHKTTLPLNEWPRHYTWKDYYGIRNRIAMVNKHGSLADRIYNRADMWINISFRNRLFNLIHFKGDSWKYEIESYKRAVKDSQGGLLRNGD